MPKAGTPEHKAWCRQNYIQHREERKAKAKAWRAAHPGYCGEYARQRMEKNPGMVRDGARRSYAKWLALNGNKEKSRIRARTLAAYGLTTDEYAKMLDRQDGRCAICRSDSPGSGHRSFAVDHDHATGRVRALLCFGCNVRLGWYEKWIASIDAYLKSHSASEVA